MPVLERTWRLAVQPPNPRDAVTILASYAGSDAVAAEPAAAADVVRDCEHLPLALAIAGSQAADHRWPLHLLAQRLADPTRRLDALTYRDLSVRDRMATGYRFVEHTDPVAAKIFRTIPRLHCELSPHRVAAVTGLPTLQAWAGLERLAEAHLITTTGPAHYQLTELTRSYAEELAATEPHHIFGAEFAATEPHCPVPAGPDRAVADPAQRVSLACSGACPAA